MLKRRPRLKPRKKPVQERSRDTVEVILQATTYILTTGGYGALTTNRIAERAGVNIATLYQYFPNKEAIFAELMRRHVVETRAAAVEVLRARRGTSVESTVRASIESTIAAHRTQPALHRIFTEEGARLGLAPIEAPADEELARLGQEWAAKARKSTKNPELAMWVVKTAIHSLLHQAIVERPGEIDRPELAEELTRLVVSYLKPSRRT